MRVRGIAIAVIALAAQPAFAQDAPLDKVYACAAKTDNAERLACYDAAVAGLKQAQTSGGVAVVARSQIEAAEKEAFGLSQPSLSELARSANKMPATPGAAAAPPPQELDRVTMTVKALERRPDGTYRFTMENGQVWEQIDGNELGKTLRAPVTAEIKKGAIGSYMLKVGDRASVRVRRIK